MKKPRRPDVKPRATFEWNTGNLGDCRSISYHDMWKRYLAAYGHVYQVGELKQIHDKWRRIMSEL